MFQGLLPRKKKRTSSFGIKFGWNFKRFPNHWNKVWFRARLLLLNKHFARKNYVLIFYIVWISLNMSISVVVLHAHALNKCITMSPRWGNHAKPPPKFILRKFKCITNPTPARRVTPPRNVYMAKFDPGWEGYLIWQTGLPALAGHLTYHVDVIKLKWENIWTGGLLHLPGVPHLHVNRPLVVFVELTW